MADSKFKIQNSKQRQTAKDKEQKQRTKSKRQRTTDKGQKTDETSLTEIDDDYGSVRAVSFCESAEGTHTHVSSFQ